MITTDQVRDVLSSRGNVFGAGGTKIGSIGQVYTDDQTSRPEWVTVKTGMFGAAESFVPLARARVSGTDLLVPFAKETIKDAPKVADSDGHLTQEEEAELYRYYGLDYSRSVSDSGLAGSAGHDTSGPTTDEAMTRSEERVNVGTRSEETGRVRLRKYVVTENVTQTVPVRKEKAVLEREPVAEENLDQAMAGPAISEEEHEVTLRAERPVVEKEAVPVERVRLGTEKRTQHEIVGGEVRKEQIEVDADDRGRRDRDERRN
jgi:uncharacterized protein (TIGR02271 family)